MFEDLEELSSMIILSEFDLRKKLTMNTLKAIEIALDSTKDNVNEFAITRKQKTLIKKIKTYCSKIAFQNGKIKSFETQRRIFE